MKAVALMISLLVLAGCERTEASKVSSKQREEAQSVVLAGDQHSKRLDSRVSVIRVGVVDDDLAYGGSRGVYVITDAKTGIEYIGVSGVGIAVSGSHLSGKTTVQDER